MVKLSLKLESLTMTPTTATDFFLTLYTFASLSFFSETVQLSEDSFKQAGPSHHLDSTNCFEEQPLQGRSDEL